MHHIEVTNVLLYQPNNKMSGLGTAHTVLLQCHWQISTNVLWLSECFNAMKKVFLVLKKVLLLTQLSPDAALLVIFPLQLFMWGRCQTNQKLDKNRWWRERERLKMDEVKRLPSTKRETSFIMPLFVYLHCSVVAATAVRLIAVAGQSVI